MKDSKVFIYDVGDIINDGHRYLKILNAKKILTNRKDGKNYMAKMYHLQCLNCGWDNLWLEECDIKRGRGCSCCSGKTVVPGINSVADIYPWITDYFIGGYNEASKYTPYTEKRVIFQCPYCKEKSQPFLISNIIKNHGFSCSCKSSLSFPELLMKKLLDKLGITYTHQLTNKTFDWVGKYRYDFYLPYYNMIIETHGIQHYKESSLTQRTLQEEIDNDNIKINLAKSNSIDYYFIIDCSESSISYIQKSILNNSKMCSLLNINEISFSGLELYDDNEYTNICNLWNNTEYSILTISNKLGLDRERVKNILLLSAKNGHTNFSNEQMNNRKIKSISQKSKPIQCIDNGICFKNVYLCESLSPDLFGIKLCRNSITYHIKMNSLYKGFLFKYISAEEFNKIKKESPGLAFGDSFVL